MRESRKELPAIAFRWQPTRDRSGRASLPKPFRDRRDTPLILVVHLIAVGLDNAASLLRRLHIFFLIDADKSVGILGHKIDHCGKHLDSVLDLLYLPIFDRFESLLLAVAYVDLGERLVAPLNSDLARTRAVAFLDHHSDKLGLIELGYNDDLLIFLYVYTHTGDKSCIASEICFFHFINPFLRKNIFSLIIISSQKVNYNSYLIFYLTSIFVYDIMNDT